MYLGFDPLYIILMVPVFLFSMWAQFKVKSSFKKFSKIAINSGITGADAAKIILDKLGVKDVKIEKTSGWLSDHYSPANKTLRLSQGVYDSDSVAAVGVAAHEAGHAIQHFKGMMVMRMWMALSKPATIMSNGSTILIIIGLIFNFLLLAQIGFIFFLVVVVFQIITLPLEFNASNRAKKLLFECGIVTNNEVAGVNSMLTSAAMTYVAATAAALVQVLYFALMLFGRRR